MEHLKQFKQRWLEKLSMMFQFLRQSKSKAIHPPEYKIGENVWDIPLLPYTDCFVSLSPASCSMMYFITIIISSILALTVTAIPTASPPAGGDQCGPTVQIPSDPKETCSAGPSPISLGSSATFGIAPLSNGKFKNFDKTICGPVVTTICNIMANSSTMNGTWYFSTSHVPFNNRDQACQMGFYLPSDPGAAPRPLPPQCQNIFSSIQSAFTWGSTRMISDWYGATVNLKVNPATGLGQFPLPGGSGTGEQAP